MGSDLGFAIMICQLAPIATQCAAFGMVSNEHEVCNRKNENKKWSSLTLVVKIDKVSMYASDKTHTDLFYF